MTFRSLKNASVLLILICFIAACSGGGSSSSDSNPSPTSEHSANYLLQHAAEASGNLGSCQSCHGSDYAGVGDAISCRGCHANAPSFDVHISAYSDPSAHGAAARAAQNECLGCHGMSPNIFDGGILSDPNLFNIPDANCSTAGCHTGATAHPTNWQGSNEDTDPSYGSSHRNINATIEDESCALCHKVDGLGQGANPDAPSCFVPSYQNSASASATTCH